MTPDDRAFELSLIIAANRMVGTRKHAEISRVIREAENAAIERCAKVADDGSFHVRPSDIADGIRALKHKEPTDD